MSKYLSVWIALLLPSLGFASANPSEEIHLDPVPLNSGPSQPRGNAVALRNAFIATFVKDNPAWKAEIRLMRDPNQEIPDGAQLGYSSRLRSYYSFRPKFWEELLPDQKREVLADPRLRSFIVSSRNQLIFPAITNAETGIPTDKNVFPVEGVKTPPGKRMLPAGNAIIEDKNTPLRISISPEEMLRREPMEITVQ